LKGVLEAIGVQRVWEDTSNRDVAASQLKYYKQAEDEKNKVRVARRVMANGGLIHDPPAWDKYNSNPAVTSLAQETPDESRKIFEQHVKEAAAVVKTENTIEAKRTTQIAKMDA